MSAAGAPLDVRSILAASDSWSEANERVSLVRLTIRTVLQLLQGIGSTRAFYAHILHPWQGDTRTYDRCLQQLAECSGG